MKNQMNLFNGSTVKNIIVLTMMLFCFSFLYQTNTIAEANAITVTKGEETSIDRTPTMIDNPQLNIEKPENKPNSRECYWMSYFQNISYPWKAPHPTYGDEYYAMRFSSYDTLKLVDFYVYDPEDGTFGNDTVYISVWGDNGNELPDINNMLAQISFPPGTYNAYPIFTTADFSALNLEVSGNFHISFSSSGTFPNDFESCISDDGNHGTGRSSVYYDGAWGTMDAIWGADVNFIFNVKLCGAGKLCYYDLDGDTFGDVNNFIVSICGHCHEESGHTDDSTDCDDTDSTIYPGAYDIPHDGIDQNCDGVDSTCCLLRGDVAIPKDGIVLVDDIVFLVDWLFKGGVPLECMEAGDCTIPLDGQVLIDDVVWLVNYLFKGGDAPPAC